MLRYKNIRIFSPKDEGHRDLYLFGDGSREVQDFSGENLIAIPGLVDGHVHITGGGGEKGPQSRIDPLHAEDLFSAGITSVVGLLGTDHLSRSLENLLAQARALEEEGMTTRIYTGSYRYPSILFTENVERDLFLIDKVIGVKLALSDHRASQITSTELVRLISQVRIGGMLKGRRGLLHIHMGDAPEGLTPILQLAEKYPYYSPHCYPTHMNRKRELFKQGLDFLRFGGQIDLSAGFDSDEQSLSVKEALDIIFNSSLPKDKVSVSSDAGGSTAVYNPDGSIEHYEAQSPKVLWQDFLTCVSAFGLEKALPFFTKNPAKILSLSGKGILQNNLFDDVLILNDRMEIQSIYTSGKIQFEQ